MRVPKWLIAFVVAVMAVMVYVLYSAHLVPGGVTKVLIFTGTALAISFVAYVVMLLIVLAFVGVMVLNALYHKLQ